MEIHRIEICNINSIKGEYPIDFMSGQLKGQDLFAITGKTGSGKSTILDAITLALYNKVPRLDGKTGKSDEKSKDPYKRLKPEDTENCLTRGEKRGYAKVVFEASGKLYKAEWICELKNIKFSGSHSLYLVEHDSGIEKMTSLKTHNLKNEFDRYGRPVEGSVAQDVVELIGLGYDQFCKSCILAQNSFANFLKASDDEKTDILEKITGTSIYGKIAGVIVKGYEKALKEKEALDNKVSGQEAFLIQDPVELTQVRDDVARLETEKKNLEEEIRKLDEGLGWWNEFERLTKKKDEAHKNKEVAEENMKRLSQKMEKLNRHDAVSDGMTLFNRETDLEKDFGKAGERVAEAEKALNDNKTEIERKNMEKEEESQNLATQQASLEEMAWIKPIKENIKFIQTEYQALDKVVASLKKAATEQNLECRNLDEKGLMEDIARMTGNLEPELTQEKVRERLTVVQKELDVCDNAASLFPKMETVQKLDKEDEADFAIVSGNIRLQEELKTEIDDLYDQISALENKDIKTKRSKLKEGQPCELCGATEHPYATETVVNEYIESIKEKWESKKGEKRNIDAIIQNAQGRILVREGQRGTLAPEIDDLKKKIASKDISFQTIFSKYKENDIIQELKNKAGEKERWDDERKKAENTLASINLRDLLEDANTHRKNLDESLPEGWYSKRLADRDGYVRSLKDEIECYTKAEEKVGYTNEKILKISSSIETLTKQIPKLNTDIEDKKKERKEILKKRNDAVQAMSDWITTFNAGHEIPVTREELAAQKEDKTNWQELRTVIGEADKKCDTTANLFKIASEDLQGHEEGKPVEDAAQLRVLRDLAEKKLKGSQDGENAEEGVEAQWLRVSTRLSMHDAADLAIAGYKEPRKAAEEKIKLWGRFYEMLSDRKGGDKNAKDFRRNAQNYTLGLLLDYANKQLDKFTKRYKLKKQNDSTLEIMVVDGELGERYASSLSGGETFMVSLALALGLSNISSGSVSIKNLFIDEGFGTLDTDTQKTVIGALNTLRAQGKRVGLISHTAALIGDDNIYKIRVERKEGEKFSRIEWD